MWRSRLFYTSTIFIKINFLKVCFLSLDILKIWIDLFFSVLNKFNEIKINERNNYILVSLCSEQILFQLFSQILSVHLNSNKQIKECVISTCGINILDENINEIKGKVFDWFIKLMTMFYANFSEINQLRTSFSINVNAILVLAIKTLLSFCMVNAANFQTFIEHKKNEYCLIKILNFINKGILNIDYLQTIFQYKTE